MRGRQSSPQMDLWREGTAGEELTFTFTPTDGALSGAQLNGEDIEFAADGCTYTTMPGEAY